MNLRLLLVVLGLLGALPLGMRLARAGGPRAVESHFPDGTLESRTSLREGVREGASTRYWQDGSVRAQGRYRDDLREGPWIWYREDGSIDHELSGRFERGERVGPL